MKHDIFFFPRLAAVNLRKNQQTYLPFLLSVTGCFAAVFMLANIAYGPGISDLPGGDALLSMLTFGIAVLCLFSVAFILYTNSFLMKRRKRELALYAILGLERRHVARTLFWESLYAYLLTTAAGLLTGVLLGKLMFLLMLRIVRYPTALDYTPSPLLALITIAAFGGVFLIVLLTNLVRIGHASPVALLQSENAGEREPRASWLITLVGIAALGWAYWIALTVQSPLQAMAQFFVAVILVILGTFALFTSGSVRVLKTLRTWRRFYYRPRNFVSVSGMIYRMKQNAAGLASICILSTMVLVTLSTTIALYAGSQENINLYYPTDMALSWPAEQGPQEDMIGRIRDAAIRHGVAIEDEMRFREIRMQVRRDGNVLLRHDAQEMAETGEAGIELHLLTLDEYNQLAKTSASLQPGEILFHSNQGVTGIPELQAGSSGPTYVVREELRTFPTQPNNEHVQDLIYTVVLADASAASVLSAALLGPEAAEPAGSLRERYLFNLSGDSNATYAVAEETQILLWNSVDNGTAESRQRSTADWFGLFGGFLFIGIFIGAMFLMATVLIIYYKQVSEGYQDRVRFEILQKVGMDRHEVGSTIRRQILMVFFLPLAGAVLHLGFSFGFLPKMLALFGLYNVPLYVLCAVLTLAVFALIYLVVFAVTARTYGRLVRFDAESA